MTSQLDHSPPPMFAEAPEQPSRWVRTVHRVRTARPRTLWLNIALAVLLVAGGALAWLTVGNPSTPPSTARTTTVSLGTVTASVTGSGNAASALSTAVNFTGSGVVSKLDVKVGDRVRLGQVLAQIDPTSANQSLRTAQAGLDSAQAQYLQATQGETALQKQKDQLSITQANQGVTSAQNGVTNAQTQLTNDTVSLANAIDNAGDQLNSDDTATSNAISNAQTQLNNDQTGTNTAVSNAQAQLSNDTAVQSTAVSNAQAAVVASGGTVAGCPAVMSTSTTCQTLTNGSQTRDTVLLKDNQAITSAQQARDSTIAKDQQALTSARTNRDATLTKDHQAITTAQQNQAATLAKDNQAIVSAKQQVITAQGQVASAKLAAATNATPSTPAQIAQARAGLTSAQVQVDVARTAVDNTVLKAPQAGTVLAVNGKVGQSSSGTSSSGSSSGTSGSSGSGSSSSSSASSSSTSGFVTLANVSRLAVTANIAEADAANVKLGQPATITFSATNTSTKGTVTLVSPTSTVTNNVVLYPVTVSLDSAPEGVKVGATASISITTGSAADVLVAPSSAVTTLGTRHTVTVRRNGVNTVVPVEIGLIGNSGTEITSGVSEGDELVLPTSTGTTTTNGGGFPRLGGAAEPWEPS
ncbi:MAG TPA: HlyD family efflux transporter periplasmic adaptor subunit, partial [Kineosporiaceae bacterium]|nr:HlyD family efflux transporter periplasmic adaptor subunit [Kineosporiaceae bacterium]